jgi:SseB protein C-terminal domain
MWFNKKSEVEKFHARQVTFVGEQDGDVERLLKSNLTFAFSDQPTIRSAYLARVSYGDSQENSVALCLNVADKKSDGHLASVLGQVFSKIFDDSQALDIIFLSEEQEVEVRHVCAAFYIEHGR